MSTRAKKGIRHASQCPARVPSPTKTSAMKNRILFTALCVIVPTVIAAQTPTRERRETDPQTQTDASAMRTRVIGPKASNHSESQKPRSDTNTVTPPNQNQQGSQTWGNSAFIIRPSSVERPAQANVAVATPSPQNNVQPAKKLVQPTALVTPAVRPETATPRISTSARPTALTGTYNVGIGDVLDVRLSNVSTRESTLFTVLKNGTLEYPLLSAPISVAGLSTDDVARLLTNQIKVIKSPRITVTVRDYASHAVVVGGLVDSPGRKILRREALPLFAVLAEALVRAEATEATILRNGKDGEPLSLKDDKDMATLVLPGDVIKISGADAAAKKFLYVGGEVSSPGEKAFREGMTLTQALLSAGGASSSGKIIKVARRNASGFLSTNEYNLRSIEGGKTPDPVLEAGDRIEVVRGS